MVSWKTFAGGRPPAGGLVKTDGIGRLGLYKVGDKVVYPHHGAGTVVKKEKRKVLGEEREYLQIQILHNDMTVQVPTENADRVGLRKVIDETTVEQVLKGAEKAAGAPIKVTKFVRYALGEGIDKKDGDFAAEVAAAAGKR